MHENTRTTAARAIGRSTLMAGATLLLLVGGFATGCGQMAQSQYLEGLGEERRGDLQEAEDCYEDALDYNPNHVPTMRRLAQLKVDSRDYQEAIPLYERALKASKGSAESYNDLATCYVTAGDLDDAEATFERGVKAHPKDVVLQSNYGALLARQDRVDDALSHYRAVLPEAEAHRSLGRALYEAGDRAAAHKAFERARELQRRGNVRVANGRS
jgi:protein O-GlcNAc transferase